MDKKRLDASTRARVIEIDLEEIGPGPILGRVNRDLHCGNDSPGLAEGILSAMEEFRGHLDIRVPVVLDHEVQELVGGRPGENPIILLAGNDEGVAELPVGEQPADVGRDGHSGLGHLLQRHTRTRFASSRGSSLR